MKGIDAVFVGHTPVESIIEIENVVYIDTGACFGRALTMVNMASGEAVRVKVSE